MSTEPASFSNVSRWPDDGDLAFLSFSLGPVQSFIASARTVRDLWTGSYLLSYLTFEAMKPVLEEGDPEQSFVMPDVTQLPLWLIQQPVGTLSHRPSEDELLLPCIPNVFIAVVPVQTRAGWRRRARTAAATLGGGGSPPRSGEDWMGCLRAEPSSRYSERAGPPSGTIRSNRSSRSGRSSSLGRGYERGSEHESFTKPYREGGIPLVTSPRPSWQVDASAAVDPARGKLLPGGPGPPKVHLTGHLRANGPREAGGFAEVLRAVRRPL